MTYAVLITLQVVKKSTGDSEEDIYGEPPTESPTEEQATKRQRIDTVDPSAAAVEMGDRLSDDDEVTNISDSTPVL